MEKMYWHILSKVCVMVIKMFQIQIIKGLFLQLRINI